MLRELSPFEQAGQPSSRVRADREVVQHPREVFERRLGRPPRQAVGRQDTLEPRVGRDHGPAWVRFGTQVVERLLHRGGELGRDPVLSTPSSPRAGLRARPAYHHAPSASRMSATATLATPQENRAWTASELPLVVLQDGVPGPIAWSTSGGRPGRGPSAAVLPATRTPKQPTRTRTARAARAAALRLAPRAGGAGRGDRPRSLRSAAIVSRYSVKRMSTSVCVGLRRAAFAGRRSSRAPRSRRRRSATSTPSADQEARLRRVATLHRRVRRRSVEERLQRPAVMGIVNVTPDSFSDGGAPSIRRGGGRGRRMVGEGAAIVDVGGESTRPGSTACSRRGGAAPHPARARAAGGLPVSIDTAKSEVARRALELGAELVNDVTALRGDPDLAGVVADGDAYLCLMHMQGEPRTMQVDPARRRRLRGGGVPRERLAFAVAAGIPEERIRLDPGIGFGKRGSESRVRPAARTPRRARTPGADRALAQELARRLPILTRALGSLPPRCSGRRSVRACARSSASTMCASTSRH